MVYLLESLLEDLYPAANLANRERIASLLRRRPNFGELPFHALCCIRAKRRTGALPRGFEAVPIG
jgi:hypothetical protein